MASYYELPDDLYGFTVEELRKILEPVRRITGVRLTNRIYDYDVPTNSFKVKGVTGRFRLVAPSKKKLNVAFSQIKEAWRKKHGYENPT